MFSDFNADLMLSESNGGVDVFFESGLVCANMLEDERPHSELLVRRIGVDFDVVGVILEGEVLFLDKVFGCEAEFGDEFALAVIDGFFEGVRQVFFLFFDPAGEGGVFILDEVGVFELCFFGVGNG